MGNLLAFHLGCDWVEEEGKAVGPDDVTRLVLCTEHGEFQAVEVGMGKSQELSALSKAEEAGWLTRTDQKGRRDLWFCPTHAAPIMATGL